MQKSLPSHFLTIIPRNLYKEVKTLSPDVYPFREMTWFNMVLHRSKVQLAPPKENICGI